VKKFRDSIVVVIYSVVIGFISLIWDINILIVVFVSIFGPILLLMLFIWVARLKPSLLKPSLKTIIILIQNKLKVVVMNKILNPFRKLPEGYYRLFLVVWLLIPLVAATLLYLFISILGNERGHSYLGYGYGRGDAWYASITWFFILLIVYYPIARVVVWVWQGFHKEKSLEARYKNKLPIASQIVTTAILGRKTHNNVDGLPLVIDRIVKGKKISIEQIILRTAYGDVWLPKAMVLDDHNEVSGVLYDKGQVIFVAQRDSRTIKGSQPGFSGTAEEAKEPLYFEGDDVHATELTFRPDSSFKADRMTNARREELMFMHELGLLKAV
jgi:hypothetical protein